MRDLPAVWTSAAWQAEAQAWIRARAVAAGLRLTGPVEQVRVRFWSVLQRVSTDTGTLWFKENAPSQSFEAALVAELARLAPDAVPPVVGFDPRRGWLLTADLGVPMAQDPALAEGAAALAALAELAGSYSALQRRLAETSRDLLATGVPVHDAGQAMAYAATLADQLADRPPGAVGRLDAGGRRRVEAGLGRIGDASAVLDASGLPNSLQHNDLHLGNAFRSTPGAISLIDFADALWSHPLATVRIPLWIAASRLGAAPGSPAYQRILDAALEPWTDLATTAELRQWLPAAERLSCLHRAESWRRVMADVPFETVPEDVRDAPASWLLTAVAEDPYDDAMRE